MPDAWIPVEPCPRCQGHPMQMAPNVGRHRLPCPECWEHPSETLQETLHWKQSRADLGVESEERRVYVRSWRRREVRWVDEDRTAWGETFLWQLIDGPEPGPDDPWAIPPEATTMTRLVEGEAPPE